MVVTKHIGRLCNSMFQIATSIGYARKYGYQWAADTGSGVSDPYSAIHKVYPNLPKENWGAGSRYQEHPNEFCEIHGVHKNQCHFDYHPIPDLGGRVSMMGFFQSYKYFEGQDEEIKKVFALPHVDGYEDYVSIHVRRGDYVQHAGSFPPVDEKYLDTALDEMSQRLETKHMKIMWFSDDIEWCKKTSKNIQGEYKELHEFSEGRNEYHDLSLMASCGHHIIANSTFSWWASYLGHNPDKITVCPSAATWFGPTAGVKKPVVDLIPPHWIQIATR